MKNIEIPHFLSLNGVTATAANYAANMAKESYQALDAKTHVQFITETAETFEGKQLTIKIGSSQSEVMAITNCLHKMAELKALIAYLREAIKAKDALTTEVRGSKFTDWVEYPEQPVPEHFTEQAPIAPSRAPLWEMDDVINSWPIDRRVRYLTIQAKVANLGKLIHEEGSFNKARKRLTSALSEPIRTEGVGKDLIVYKKTSSVELSVIDSKFFELQNEWRELQKEYNSIQHEIEMEMQKHNDVAQAEYNAAYDQYRVEMEAYNSRKQKYMQEQRAIQEAYMLEVQALNLKAQSLRDEKLHEIQSLKIVIPDAHKDLYTSISNTGKE